MRIIGGYLKGKTIMPPAGYPARPTTDFAKEGLFNILENEFDFANRSLLDLFGGTGSISAEFISRGGAEAVCVEMNRKNATFISKMHRSLGIKTIRTVHCNVFDFLELCNRDFDFIFADPPYQLEGLDTLPDKIFAHQPAILVQEAAEQRAECYFILEHGGEYDFSNHPHFVKERHYGNVHFSFFK